MNNKIIYLFTAVNWYRLELFKNISKMADLKVYILNGYKVGYEGIEFSPEYGDLDIRFLDDEMSEFHNLIQILDKEKFDIIVVPSMNSLHFISLTTKLCRYYHLKGKRILYFWEYWPMECSKSSFSKKIKQGIRHLAIRINQTWIDKFIVPSIYTYSFYRKMGIPASKCVRCFNASEIEKKEYSRDIVRTSLSIGQKEKIILYFGRLEEYKGINELIKVFNRIDVKSWHLVVCGPGKPSINFKNSNIHFMGSIDPDKRGYYYSAADLFILPNTYNKKIEPWGLTVNEAMSFGLPVLVTEATGSGVDLVFHGVNGFIMSSSNLEDEMEFYIRLILSNSDMMNRMSENSLKIISNYTFENMARAFVASAVNIDNK